MAILLIRDLPEHIYRLLSEQAVRERCSPAQQAIAVPTRGLEGELDSKARRKKLLKAVRSSGRAEGKVGDPVKSIRADRRR